MASQSGREVCFIAVDIRLIFGTRVMSDKSIESI